MAAPFARMCAPDTQLASGEQRKATTAAISVAWLNFALKLSAEIDSTAHIAHLVAAGHGHTILTLPAVREHLESGRVSAARIENGAIHRTLCVVRNPTAVVTRASVRIEDLMLKVMRRLIFKGQWRADPQATLG